MPAPHDVVLTRLPPPAWPARRFLHWCGLAWGMFRRAPLRLMGLCLLPMLVEIMLQVLIPMAGVVISKLLVPIASVWCLLATDQRARSGRFAMGQAAVRALRLRGVLVQVALVSACVFGIQMSLAWGLAGPAAAWGMVVLDQDALIQVSQAQVACVLASGLLPAMLLFFTVPRMVLDRLPLVQALRENWALLGRGWRPLLVYMLVAMALVGGFVYQSWLLLLAMPWGYVSYWAYRDAFDSTDAG
jgi:hypothetical protein